MIDFGSSDPYYYEGAIMGGADRPITVVAKHPGLLLSLVKMLSSANGTTFENDSTLPISAIHNITIPAGFPNAGSNACSIDGAPGGNESRELSWTHAPHDTRSFAVVTFDETANFTHWGMYNISADTTERPQNAAVAGSTFGRQVINEFMVAAEYDGPCPPPNFPPNVHHYVFTVYALDEELTLPSSPNFPPNAETLFQALIKAGEHGHILASAKIVGLYSTTPESLAGGSRPGFVAMKSGTNPTCRKTSPTPRP